MPTTPPTPARALELVARGALVVFGLAAAVLVLAPTGHRPSRYVTEVTIWGHGHGWGWTDTGTEFALNVVLFVPLLLLLLPAFPRVPGVVWWLLALPLPLVVEVTQALVLPLRDASWNDVRANLLGVVIGGVLGHPLRWWLLRARRRERESAEDAQRDLPVRN